MGLTYWVLTERNKLWMVSLHISGQPNVRSHCFCLRLSQHHHLADHPPLTDSKKKKGEPAGYKGHVQSRQTLKLKRLNTSLTVLVTCLESSVPIKTRILSCCTNLFNAFNYFLTKTSVKGTFLLFPENIQTCFDP